MTKNSPFDFFLYRKQTEKGKLAFQMCKRKFYAIIKVKRTILKEKAF